MSVVLPRGFVRAGGRDAVAHLQSMLSNDVEAIAAGGGCYALLLTPKARVIADLEVFAAGDELVLATPPQARDDVLETLVRSRFRKKVDLEPAEYFLVWGEPDGDPLARIDTPAGTLSLSAQAPAHRDPEELYEIARIEAGVPRFGHEFSTETMPAEAGLDQRAVSFSKGCYPGQEPVARLHYRGHANRGVRGLALSTDASSGAVVTAGGKPVGTLTSVAVSPRFGAIGLGVLRREVEDGATVEVDGGPATVRPLPFAS